MFPASQGVDVSQDLAKTTRIVSCHRRKQKCDRRSPCNQCIQRKVEYLCKYPNRKHFRFSLTASSPTISPPILDTFVQLQSSGSSASFLEHGPSQQPYSTEAVSEPDRSSINLDYASGSASSADNDECGSTIDLVEMLGCFPAAQSSIVQDLHEITAGSMTDSESRSSKLPKAEQFAVKGLLRAMPPRPYADL
ncbi:hypothetical protein V1509DRAFT_78482 [Lipomyces kononenkoae]